MRLKALVFFAALLAAASTAHAQQAPDPMFGDDPYAKAVLDCHADYARRFAKAITAVIATPTEVATAAYAHCIGQFNEFAQAVAETARSSRNSTVFIDPESYQEDQTRKMRDYSFAYTLDAYLRSTTAF